MRNFKKILGLLGIVFVLCALSAGLVGCVSPSAFKVKITSPENNVTVSESPITVTGTVSGYTRGEVIYEEQSMRLAPEVTVNGVKAEVAEDGTFSAQIELAEGKNFIKAEAMFNNLTVKDMVKVNYTPAVTTLSVAIDSPEDAAQLTESPIEVTGTVSDAAAAVTVNDVDVVVGEDGTFSAPVELVEGENTITATAVLDDLTAEDSVTVTYAVPAPALSVGITSPEDGATLDTSSVEVTGLVSDAAATVTVNEAAVAVAEDGTFTTSVDLVEGANTITAVAVLDDQTVEDSITVTYAIPVPALAVEINSPVDGAELTESTAEVTGTVSDVAAAVKVNDVDVVVAEDGTFSAQVNLVEGANTITAAAVLNEQTAEDSVTVTYTVPAPVFSVDITSPENSAVVTTDSITVTGTVSDAAASVAVNSAAAVVAADGTFSAQVTLTAGENTIQAVATSGELSATDSILVTYTPPVAALTIDITSPVDGAALAESSVTVTGTISDAAAAVTVNGIQAVIAEDKTFSAQVELVEGANTITAVAVLGEQTIQDSVAVTYTIPVPALSVDITSPVDGAAVDTASVDVAGLVSDATAAVTVNGTAVVVAEDGTFTAPVTLVEGANTITVVAVLGEQNVQDSITVTYTIPVPPLAVDINSPENGTVSTTNSVTVTGTVSDVTAAVTVNDVAVVVAEDGTFSAQVPLIKGENTITAVATSGESSATDTISVSYTGPALSLEVTTNPLNVTGKVSDPAAVVTVNGNAAAVAEDGTFSAQVTLVEGENVITVVATLDGQETSYSFTVTYTPAA